MRDWSWIKTASLFDVSLAIYDTLSLNPAQVDGKCLGYLSKRMIALEAELGGPYTDEKGGIDPLTNLVISRLFTLLGAPLENVDTYLATIDPEIFKSDPRFIKIQNYSLLCAPKVTKKPLQKATLIPTKNEVTAQVEDSLSKIDSCLRQTAIETFERVKRADKDGEITGITYAFLHSLTNKTKETIKNIDKDLGIANFYIWMAYTIYDDFIDNDVQDVRTLCVANIMQRKALEKYSSYFEESEIIFNTMDEANAWELTNCRLTIDGEYVNIGSLPKYGNGLILAARSMGHVLGPLAVCKKLLPATERAANQALKHFLAARQLSDDLYDWIDDLKNGHCSYVVTYLLRRARISPGDYSMEVLIKKLQLNFMKYGAIEISERIIAHCNTSKKILLENNILVKDSLFLDQTMGSIKSVAIKTIESHKKQHDFLAVYSKT